MIYNIFLNLCERERLTVNVQELITFIFNSTRYTFFTVFEKEKKCPSSF